MYSTKYLIMILNNYIIDLCIYCTILFIIILEYFFYLLKKLDVKQYAVLFQQHLIYLMFIATLECTFSSCALIESHAVQVCSLGAIGYVS